MVEECKKGKSETNIEKAMRSMMSRGSKSKSTSPGEDLENTLAPNKKVNTPSKYNSANNSSNSEQNEEDIIADLPNILRLFKQQLLSFIEEKTNSTMQRSDFEINRCASNPHEPFEETKQVPEDDPVNYSSEGRKSYMKIRNRKNWPPTMEDLLEYISIYSQMNNIKFTSLNYEEFYERQSKKNNKEKNNKGKNKDNSKFHKKWASISQKDKTKPSPTTEISKQGRTFSAVVSIY